MTISPLMAGSRTRLYIVSAIVFLLLTGAFLNSGSSHVRQIALNMTTYSRPQPSSFPDDYLAICVAVKDQQADLSEWLVHHYYHIGIRYFYIMDDGSSPPLSETKNYGVPNSTVTFRYFRRDQRIPPMQHTSYNLCVSDYGHKHTWMAFIDADEFFETTGAKSLQSLLSEFDSNSGIGALGVSWKTHTSAGLESRPASCRKSFVKCIWDEAIDNMHIKSIVKTKFYNKPLNPHKFSLTNGTVTVGEDRRRC